MQFVEYLAEHALMAASIGMSYQDVYVATRLLAPTIAAARRQHEAFIDFLDSHCYLWQRVRVGSGTPDFTIRQPKGSKAMLTTCSISATSVRLILSSRSSK